MWRPYWAIVKDSFRAALASRVLYILLALITLLLAALAPLHLREVLDWRIDLTEDISDPQALATKLVTRRERPVLARIWERLPESLRAELEQLSTEEDEAAEAPPSGRSRSSRRPPNTERYQPLAEALNAVLDERDFYDADVWKGQFIEDEARQLIAAGVEQLSADQVRRLNRMLLSRALRPELLPADQTTTHTRYGPWRIEFLTATTTHQQLARELSSWISYIFDKFLLSIGLVVAILVTSNMVPEMFEPGSLNLLLSKPVSRWMLLVSKFVGGCAFVALLATYLFIGLWLWFGVNMGIWDRALALSIPLYIVVFAIYYAVSVLVGVIWRSAILSVILTAVFWAFCFGVGTVYSLFYTRTYQERLVAIVPGSATEAPLCTDALHRVCVWDTEARGWRSVTRLADRPEDEAGLLVSLFFVEFPRLPGTGLVYDVATQSYLRAAMNFSDRERLTQYKLEIARADATEFVSPGRLPANSVAILPVPGGPLVLTEQGSIYQLELARLLTAQAEGIFQERSPAGWNQWADALRGRESDFGEYLVKRGPDQPQPIRDARQAAYSAATDTLLLASGGTLYVFALDGSDYRVIREKQIESGGRNSTLTTWLAVGGARGLAALGNGQLVLFDVPSLETLQTYLPESRSAPAHIAASPDGRYFLVNYRNGRSWVIDAAGEGSCRPLVLPGAPAQHGVAFGPDGRLWVAYDLDRLAVLTLPTEKIETYYRPSGDILKRLLRWVVRPVYRVCPKPGEFYKLVNHLSSTSDTRYNPDVDLNETLEFEDPWSPLTTGVVFMALCLALACAVFQYSDY